MPTTDAARTDTGLAAELRVSVMRLRRRLANERDPHNTLSLGAMSVLGALNRNGEMSIGALASFERVQPPSMTRTVTCLAEEGYVERRPHPTDGRGIVVTITEAGRAVVLADRALRDEWLSRHIAALTPAERELLRAAAPILEKLAKSE